MKYQNLRANNLVMWEAIKYYSAKGFELFSFGITKPDNEGLRKFKLGWGASEGIVNTYHSSPYYSPVSIDIQVLFDGSFEILALGTAPYNPFIIANQRRDYEIHLAGFSNTSLANTTIFGTYDYDSNAAQSKFYETSNNLPWAIHIPVSFDYPTENTSIENAYLKFVEWAESGGSAFPNWYITTESNINNTYIY